MTHNDTFCLNVVWDFGVQMILRIGVYILIKFKYNSLDIVLYILQLDSTIWLYGPKNYIVKFNCS